MPPVKHVIFSWLISAPSVYETAVCLSIVSHVLILFSSRIFPRATVEIETVVRNGSHLKEKKKKKDRPARTPNVVFVVALYYQSLLENYSFAFTSLFFRDLSRL